MSDQNTLTQPQTAHFTNLFNHIADSWNQGDRSPYVDIFTEDAHYMLPHAETLIGTDAIRSFVMEFPDVKAEFKVIEVWGNSDLANVHGKYRALNQDGSLMDKGKFISVFAKNPQGQWKETHTIWNSDLPLPEMD